MRKPFTDTIRLLQGGAFADECADRLHALVMGVEETGKAGTLTIKIDVKKTGAALALHSVVTTKIPEPKAQPDVLWSTVEGNLTQQNPKQQSLELRSVDEGNPEPIRKVS